MTAQLHLAKNLQLPLDVATDTIGFLSRKGGGKTYSAGVLVEELLEHDIQTVILDPVSKWWALRAGATASERGYEVPVFGGQHGDIPVNVHGGALVADLVVDFGASLVIDVSEFTLSEQRRFVTDFMIQLLQRKKRSPSAMHLVLEEAQEFVPQKVFGDDARMVSAVQRVIKLGRNYGIGVTLISQRAASVNKDALTQVEILCVLQTTSPQDRKAIHDWIDYTGAEKAKKVVDELPKLKQGEMHLWSPGRDLYVRTKFRTKKTFDASATPKVGAKTGPPKALTPLDLQEIEKAMADVVEQAKQNDPATLRKQIHQLQAELQKAQKIPPTVVTESQIVERIIEVPALSGADAQLLHEAIDHLSDVVTKIGVSLDGATLQAAKTREFAALPQAERPYLKDGEPTVRSAAREAATNGKRLTVRFDPEPSTPDVADEIGGETIHKGAKIMLGVAGMFYPDPVSRAQLSTLSGYSIKSSTFSQYVGLLKRAGLIETPDGAIRATKAGINELGPSRSTMPPSTDALLTLWGPKLHKGAYTMLRLLVDAYPKGMSREALADRSGYSITSSTFSQYVGLLRRNQLATTGGGDVIASDTLFPVKR